MQGLFDLSARNALVTGASSGLGRHFSRVLARAGANVALAARRREALESLAWEIEAEAEGRRGVPVLMDVRDGASVARGFDCAQEALGSFHIVVNNAGIAPVAAFPGQSEAEWSETIATNLHGAWLVAREAAKRMTDADVEGSIINIASIYAFRATRGLSGYAAAKAGLVQLTRALSLELASCRIRVNAIAPGYIRTEMNRDLFSTPAGDALIRRVPQRRIGAPEDLDGALLLLASNRASGYMTGSVITIDGGHLNSPL